MVGIKVKFNNIEFNSLVDACKYIEETYTIENLHGKITSYKSSHKEISYENILEYYVNKIMNVKSRLYESKINTDGEIMTIVEYIDSADITVEFDDKTIKKHCRYSNFSSGKIRNPSKQSKYIGMHKVMNCGAEAEVVRISDKDGYLIIKFNIDGFTTEAHHSNFMKGTIKHPNYNTKINKTIENARIHIGEKIISKYNEELEIVDALSMSKMLIRFNGTDVTRWVTYKAFKSGTPYSKKHSITKNKYTLKQFCEDNNIVYNTLLNFIHKYYGRKLESVDEYIDAIKKYEEYKNVNYNNNFKNKVKCVLKQGDDLDKIYNRLKEYKRINNGLTDEQAIIHYRPDCCINILGELVIPD